MGDICTACKGTGEKRWKHRESEHHSSGSVTKCPYCNGTGIIVKEVYPERWPQTQFREINGNDSTVKEQMKKMKE